MCLQNRHRDIISKQTYRMCQISDQSGILGGAGWGDSSPDPHQLPSKRVQSYYMYLLLGVPSQRFPETDHRYGHLEEQHKFVSFVMTIWDLPLAGDGTTTGPLVAGQTVIPWRHLGNSESLWSADNFFHCPEHINLQNNCFTVTINYTNTYLTAQLRRMATSLLLRCRPVGGLSSGKNPMRDNPSGNQSIWYMCL